MWKRMRKLEAEAPEVAIFYGSGSGSGSGSGKHEMNGSGNGSSKKILEAEAIKTHRFHITTHLPQKLFLKNLKQNSTILG